MASKQIKTFVTYGEVRLAIETNEKSRVYAVNVEQFKELSSLEWQSIIQGNGYTFIEGVRWRLKKCPRIRKNYIVNYSDDGIVQTEEKA